MPNLEFFTQTGIAALRAYANHFGHASPTRTERTPSGFRIGQWAEHVRAEHGLPNHGMLSAATVAELDSLGFDWDPVASEWDAGIAALDRYLADHPGATRVPSTHQDRRGFPLAKWLTTQLNRNRSGSLPGGLIDVLTSRGIATGGTGTVDARVHQEAWNTNLARLDRFVADHGHTRVPRSYVAADGAHLGDWVAQVRNVHNGGANSLRLTTERIDDLIARGFEWDTRRTRWQANLARLDEFAATHGHGTIPVGYIHTDGFRLGGWAARIRHWRRGGTGGQPLNAGQVRELDTRGFDWNPPWGGRRVPGPDAESRNASWDDALGRLEQFVATHGHGRVPRKYADADGFRLGVWAMSVRISRVDPDASPRDPLTDDQIAQLDSLGFDWAAGRIAS